MLRGVGQRPVPAVLVGAVAIAFSGILFRLADVSPSTGAFYRCVWALPPLWLLARLENRRFGRRSPRAVGLAWLAGGFFAADLVLWHNAIDQVGAGLATVLGNTSILLTLQPVCSVAFAALIVDESPSPLQLAGAGCILAGLVIATVRRRPVPAAEPELAG